MRKWELLNCEWASNLSALQVEAGVQQGGEEYMSRGDFRLIPCHNPEAVGSRILFRIKCVYTIFTGLCCA